MQKQIEVGAQVRAESAQLQVDMETRVGILEEKLQTATIQSKLLRDKTKHATAEANKEARRLHRLEDKVSQGDLTPAEGLQRLEEVRAKLPQVEGAQRRLLGLQMGASAELLLPPLSFESAVASESGNSWMPKVGDEVLVCINSNAAGE